MGLVELLGVLEGNRSHGRRKEPDCLKKVRGWGSIMIVNWVSVVGFSEDEIWRKMLRWLAINSSFIPAQMVHTHFPVLLH